jgi:hypothetical protein
MGFSNPPPGLTTIVELLLIVAAGTVKYLFPPQTTPKTRTSQSNGLDDDKVQYPNFHVYEPTYKEGYRIEQLGPEQFCKLKPS